MTSLYHLELSPAHVILQSVAPHKLRPGVSPLLRGDHTHELFVGILLLFIDVVSLARDLLEVAIGLVNQGIQSGVFQDFSGLLLKESDLKRNEQLFLVILRQKNTFSFSFLRQS